MSEIIRDIPTKEEADQLAIDAKIQWYKNEGIRISAGEIHKYAGNRSMLTFEDDQNPDKFALVDPFDALSHDNSIARIATHADTPAALKNRMTNRGVYTERMADILEPRRLPSPDRETPGTPYTRAVERTALARVPTNTPNRQKQTVLYEKVIEVLAEELAR